MRATSVATVDIELLLLPSPLLGPATWEPVATHLRAAGWSTSVASSKGPPATTQDVLEAFLEAAPSDREVVLVPHSNAGLYAPALIHARHVAATIFVDAALPPVSGAARLAPDWLLTSLRELADEQQMLPPWSAWWDEADLEGLYPTPGMRSRVQAQEARLPLSYFESSLAIQTGWVTEPCAYLAFGDTYADELHQAEKHQWPVRSVVGGHLHALHDPELVAKVILDLLAELPARPRPATMSG